MKRYGMGIGGASLIMMFSTICLAAFSLLTLTTANREKNLTEKLSQSVVGYYAADSAAVEIKAKLQTAMANHAAVPSELNGVSIYTDGRGSFTYSCPIDGRRSISVMLKDINGKLKVMTWNETDTQNWVPEEQLKLWEGDETSCQTS